MKKKKDIELNLGKPHHGWVPIEFKSDEFELSFISSKIPESPTDKMCDALILCLNNVESEFRWNLEPDIYFFKLTPKENLINISISQSNSSEIKDLIYEFDGDFNSVILPMYRSLKEFDTLEYGQADWIKIEQTRLNKLTALVTDKKTAYNKSNRCTSL